MTDVPSKPFVADGMREAVVTNVPQFSTETAEHYAERLTALSDVAYAKQNSDQALYEAALTRVTQLTHQAETFQLGAEQLVAGAKAVPGLVAAGVTAAKASWAMAAGEVASDKMMAGIDKSLAATAAAKASSASTGFMSMSGVAGVMSATMATAAAIVKQATSQSFTSNDAPPASLKNFRGRTGTPYSNDRGANPATYIQVAYMPSNPQTSKNLNTIPGSGAKFNSFFITDSQETDAEKADVSETFGEPHVFATGRYMRKVMISGVCRTGPVNSNPTDTTLSEQDRARFKVPNTLGLRVLYDNVLRASVQIANGLFSRLVIDGEVYCGWFTTLNISRSGSEESFAHFTMSMLVFSRYHALETEAIQLFPAGGEATTTYFTDKVAAKILEASAGKMTIKLSATTTQIAQKLSESSSGSLSFKTPVTITTTGVAQPVKVLALYQGKPIHGVDLLYGNSASSRQLLDGSALNAGTYDVVPFVRNFQAFLASLRDALSGGTGSTRNPDGSMKSGTPLNNSNVPQSLVFTISPAMEPWNVSLLTAAMTLDLTQSPTISGLSLRFGTAQEDYDAAVTLPAKTVFQTATTSTVKMRFTLQAQGSGPINLGSIGNTKITLWHPTKDTTLQVTGAVLSANVGPSIPSPDEADLKAAARPLGARALPPPTIVALVASLGSVELTLVLNYAMLPKVVDMQSINPFTAAKDLVTSFRLKLEIPGYGPVITPVVSIDAQLSGASWLSNFLTGVKSVRYEQTPLGGTFTQMTFTVDPTAKERIASDPTSVKTAVLSAVGNMAFTVAGGTFDTTRLRTGSVTDLTDSLVTVTSNAFNKFNNSYLSAPMTMTVKMPTGLKAIPTYAPKA